MYIYADDSTTVVASPRVVSIFLYRWNLLLARCPSLNYLVYFIPASSGRSIFHRFILESCWTIFRLPYFCNVRIISVVFFVLRPLYYRSLFPFWLPCLIVSYSVCFCFHVASSKVIHFDCLQFIRFRSLTSQASAPYAVTLFTTVS